MLNITQVRTDNRQSRSEHYFDGLACRMRQLSLLIVMFSVCVIVFAQSKESDDVLLAKTRALYDAPFGRRVPPRHYTRRF